MLVPVARFSLEEIACGICTVDLEPLVRGRQVARLVPAQIVQDGSDGVGLAIAALELGGPVCDDEAEEPAPDAVIVSHVTEIFSAEEESFGYQWGVGDLDSGDDSSWER